MDLARQAAAIGQPAVKAKGLERIALRRKLQNMWRLDVAPFSVLYVLAAIKIGMHAGRFEWEQFTISCYIMMGLVLLNALAHLFTHWSMGFKTFATTGSVSSLEDAELVLVVPVKFNGSTELVPLDRKPVKDGVFETEELSFDFRRQRFVYNPQEHVFEKLRFPDKETFDYYSKCSGHGTEAKQLAAFDRYGPNRVDVPLPPFGSLLKEHLIAPFFVFQVFCVLLWMLDEYWYYSLFTLFMLVTFECTLVAQRLRNLKELRSLQTPKQSINVYRCGKWEVMKGEALLPGDVISIGRPTGDPAAEDKVVPADCLLLAGTCITEEAVLTGESTPQWKVHISDVVASASGAAERLSLKAHKAHVLFGGTKILQHTGDKSAKIRTPDGGCLAVVLRTGFETAQGRLMRTILFSTERVTANNAEAGLFIAFLLVWALAAAYYVLKHGLEDAKRSRFKLLLNCIMIVTSVIPPELPMELAMAVNASLLALAKKRVYCTEPFRIPFAGKVEVCCFDKTGTLTTDHLLLEGLVGDPHPRPAPPTKGSAGDAVEGTRRGSLKKAGKEQKDQGGGAAGKEAREGKEGGRRGVTFKEGLVEDGAGGEGEGARQPDEDELQDPALVKDPRRFGPGASLVLATCHSLVQVAEAGGEVVGDPLEKAALEAIGWSYGNEHASSPDRRVRAQLLHRYHFNSNLKRMSAIVRLEDDSPPTPTAGAGAAAGGGSDGLAQPVVSRLPGVPTGGSPAYVVVSKGAPEVIKGLLGDVPSDYVQQYKRYAAEGARVIALATRVLPEMDTAALRALGREQVEENLVFAGFAVFQCPLKPDSAPALEQLAGSSHQLVMITGDAPLTACYAAARVHIVDRPVLVLGHVQEDKGHSGGHTAPGTVAGAQSDAEYEWVSPDESVVVPFSRELDDMLAVAQDYDLAVSGDALAYAESIGVARELIPLCQVFARVSPEQKELVLKTLRAVGYVTLMCGDGTNDVGGLKAAHVGVALLSASESAEKQRKKAKKAAAEKEKEKGAGKPGDKAVALKGPVKRTPGQEFLEKARAQGRTITPYMEKTAKWMDNMHEQASGGMDMGDMPLLKPGDASMASPFTAKSASVMPCTDIIKQGRCTLVTTVQMFKILGLCCLSTAYSLSVLYLQGVKLSDTQATGMGMLSAGLFLFLSQAKPLTVLSPTRPHNSIFNFYFFGSLMGQFAVHLGLLIYFYNLALSHMPAVDRLSSDSEFKPNLVNSVCYIVQASVQMMTFAVNYVGHPFNTSIRENKGMFNCLRIGSLGIMAVASGVVPALNESIGMVYIPEAIRVQLVVMCLAAFLFTWHWERFLRAMFPAPVPPAKGYMRYVGAGAAAQRSAAGKLKAA